LGLKGGYRYNSVLHHGFAVSAGFRVNLLPRLALEIFEGLSIFPSSSGALRRELSIPPSTHLLYSSSFQFLDEGIEVIWYP
jgi:hypothetical protein